MAIRYDVFSRDGVKNREGKFGKLDLRIGSKWGYWEVLAKTVKRYRGNVIYECKCVCGKMKDISRIDLVNGRTQSCGCQRGYLCKQSWVLHTNRRCKEYCDQPKERIVKIREQSVKDSGEENNFECR